MTMRNFRRTVALHVGQGGGFGIKRPELRSLGIFPHPDADVVPHPVALSHEGEDFLIRKLLERVITVRHGEPVRGEGWLYDQNAPSPDAGNRE